MSRQGFAFIGPGTGTIARAYVRRLLEKTSIPVIALSRSSEATEKLINDTQHLVEDKDVVCDRHNIQNGLKRLSIISADTNNDESLKEASDLTGQILGQSGYLRYAIVNPGKLLKPEKAPDQVERENLMENVNSNLVAPIMITKYWYKYLPIGRRRLTEPMPNIPDELPSVAVWAIITARIGSIGDNHQGGWYSYRATKAGLNQYVKSLNVYLAANSQSQKSSSPGDSDSFHSKAQAISVALHPGTVDSPLSAEVVKASSAIKARKAEESVPDLMKVVSRLESKDGGLFYDYQGTILPW